MTTIPAYQTHIGHLSGSGGPFPLTQEGNPNRSALSMLPRTDGLCRRASDRSGPGFCGARRFNIVYEPRVYSLHQPEAGASLLPLEVGKTAFDFPGSVFGQ